MQWGKLSWWEKKERLTSNELPLFTKGHLKMILFQTLYVKKDPGHVKRAKVKMNGLSQAEGRHGI